MPPGAIVALVLIVRYGLRATEYAAAHDARLLGENPRLEHDERGDQGVLLGEIAFRSTALIGVDHSAARFRRLHCSRSSSGPSSPRPGY